MIQKKYFEFLFFFILIFPLCLDAKIIRTNSVRVVGHVKDAHSGNPIAAVAITVNKTNIATFTQLDGRYSLDTLPGDKFTVTIAGSGYVPIEVNFPEITVDTVIVLDTVLVSVNVNESKNNLLVPHKTLFFGVVKNQRSGDIIPDVKIQLPMEGPVLSTDKNGFFTIMGPDTGSMRLIFSHEEYYPEVIDYAVIPGTLQQVEVLLIPVLTLEEETGSLSGNVTDKELKPVQNAVITVENTNDTITTDSNGEFKFRLIQPGMYALKIKADGLPVKMIAPVVIKKGRHDKLEIILGKESDTNDTNNSGKSAIYGIVKKGDGTPLQSAIVNILNRDIQTVTDEEGYFSFSNLESGDYSIYVINDRHDTAFSDEILLARGRTEYTTIKFENAVQMLSDTVLPSPEKAQIHGKLIDSENGGVLAGVAITANNTKVKTLSDQNGRYLIDVIRSGSYELKFSKTGFVDSVVSVSITRGEVALCNVTLKKSDVQELSKLTVQGKAVKSTDEAVLYDRKKASIVSDVISGEQISRQGAPNAAEALRVVPGIIVVDDKYVVIRGLSGRLVSTSLNGQWIPSPDPDELQFPLDLLPTGLVNNITVEKSFTADRRGDFGGGLVDIETRKSPEKPTLKASLKVGSNTNVIGNDTFISYEGGKLDWLGMDDGTREVPGIFSNKALKIPNSETITEKDSNDVKLLDSASKSFNNIWGFKEGYAGHDLGGSLELGNRFERGDLTVGGLALVNYSRKFDYYAGGRSARYEATGTEGQSSLLIPTFYRSDRSGAEKVLWGTLLSGEAKLREDHSIDVTYFYVKSSEDIARILYGPVANIDFPLETRVLKFVERDLAIAQVKGAHTFKADIPLTIDWRGSWCSAQQQEPDMRLFLMSYQDSGNYMIHGTQPQPSRYYRKLLEDGFQGYADFTVHLDGDEKGTSDYVKFGAAYQKKNRTYNEQYFEFIAAGGSPVSINSVGGDPSVYLNDSCVGLLHDTVIIKYNRPTRTYDTIHDYTWGVYVRSLPFNADYSSQMVLPSTYVNLGWTFFEILKATGGIRLEYASRKLDMRDSGKADVDSKGKIDFLPGLGVVLSPVEEMNVRLSYTKTVSRPTEREMAEGGVYDASSGLYLLGNSKLKPEQIQSMDLRWEWYRRTSDLLSATLFCKIRKDPLEYSIDQQKNQMKPGNVSSGSGVSYGIELEGRLCLDAINQKLKNLSVVGNVSFVHSKVPIDSEELEQKRRWNPSTPSTRPLTYQAPYAWNLCLVYENEDRGIGATVVANNVGPYIVARNAQAPDVIQKSQPFRKIPWMSIPMVTATVKVKIPWKMEISAEAKNLFDPDIQQVLDFKEKQYIATSKTKGRSFSLKVGYSF